MEGWQEVSRIPNAIPTRKDPMPVSNIIARCFDSTQSLLWCGDDQGRIASYFNAGHGLARYTSFVAQGNGISGILTNPAGVITTSAQSVRLHNRRGVLKHKVEDTSLAHVNAVAFAAKGTTDIVVGGNQKELVRINIDRGTVAARVPHDGHVTNMCRGSTMLGVGLASGSIEVVDPTTLKSVRRFVAHQGAISDMDCRDNIVVTCGFSRRKNGEYVSDPMVNIYDIRAMKPLPPIAFPAGAAFVRMHPKLSTCCIVASQSGQVQFLDIANPANVQLYQSAITSLLSGLEISSTGDFMALTDTDGFVQLWSTETAATPQFTEYPVPMEFPTVQDAGYVLDDVNDPQVPLSSVGMPYYKEELLSSWSDPSYVFEVGMPPAKIDQDVMNNLKVLEGVRYAPNTKKMPRNLAQKYTYMGTQRRSSVTLPKFISEKERTGEVEDQSTLFSEKVKAGKIPKVYRKLEIQYSKFGISDFDFDFFNSTEYSGLETQLSSSYCNSLLQLYRFSPLFYNFAVNSVAKYNNDGPSLLSEMGLMFDMIYKANGKHCRAGNFVKTLSALKEARDLGLVYDDVSSTKPVSDGVLAQYLVRFLMARIEKDELAMNGGDENQCQFRKLAGIQMSSTMKSLVCGAEYQSQRVDYTIELQRPPSPEGGRSGFIDTLQKNLEKWNQTRGYCQACRKYQAVGMLSTVRKLPQLLNLSIPLEKVTELDRKAWRSNNWPAVAFGVQTQRGKLTIVPENKMNQYGTDRYRLNGIVCEIANRGDEDNHLVCLTRVDTGKWYLFNDFLVKQISEEEALDFSMPWKTPVLLLYQKDTKTSFDYESWKQHMDTSLLYEDRFIAGQREGFKKEYELLTREEAPTPGTLVAMDAEFVMLHEEETEIRSDGSKSMLVPTLLSLARVSVLRGEGPRKGVAFIDDYIATTDPIVDYLTSFSGIEDGDLDPQRSHKGLVSLETSYKKLWLLLNMGCVFIGHGLHNDFRTINIRVPKSQVIDTLEIFYLKSRQRKLSLKFLAWYLLDESVQTGNHDSIEDAQTALSLYDKYIELAKTGDFIQTLERVYDEGRKYNFKPPGFEGTPAALATTPLRPSGPQSISRVASGTSISRTLFNE
ncbi:Pan2p-PAN3 deadenylation complex catalytic subunit Pan2p [Trichomonascus vanleenenianus]|uniref:poly(A)-specific ribonuclease n=1 Tax=Trichomonascus vanleenenianus TaxID=2268995 RepID=UPI003ECA73A1